jgi:hypothetical protein
MTNRSVIAGSRIMAAAVLVALSLALSLLFIAMAFSPPHIDPAELPPGAQSLPETAFQAADLTLLPAAPKTNHSPALANESAVALQAPWRLADVKAGQPAITLSDHIVDYTVVELPQPLTVVPSVGEQVSLPILGSVVQAKVESARYLQNGDYSWSGHLDGYGSDYLVVMTYGERSVFATITTPQGSYSMESMDGLGWLYKNPAEIELSAHGSSDFLEVDIPPQ